MIISLPIFLISKVKLNLRTKLTLGSVFLLGGFVTVFAIIRIIVTNTNSVHPEVSWLNLWSAIECSIAVIICCLMVFKQLLTSRKGGTGSSAYGSAQGRSRPRQAGYKKDFGNRSSSPSAGPDSQSNYERPESAIALGNFSFVEAKPAVSSVQSKIRVTTDFTHNHERSFLRD